MNNVLIALGVFALVVLGALFAVPLAIDWDRYRGQIEDEAGRLVGRDVRISGPVSIRFLPTPYLSVSKLRIADNAARSNDAFVRAERFTAYLAIAPLMRGMLEAREIELAKPVLHLSLDQAGVGNWQDIGRDLKNATFVPNDVALQSVNIADGAIVLHDEFGNERARLSAINGELSSSTLEGPYRFRGTVVTADGTREVRISTAKPEGDGALKFRGQMRNPQGGNQITLDGRIVDAATRPRVEGDITGQIALMRRSSAEAQKVDLPIELKGRLAADANGGRLSELTLAVDIGGRPQTLTGDIRGDWRGTPSLDTQLTARFLDLDRLADAKPDAPALETLRTLADNLALVAPAGGRGTMVATLETATLGGETISGVRLAARSSDGVTRIEEMGAQVPGGARVDASGSLTGSAGRLAFDGDVTFFGASFARAFAWAGGDASAKATKSEPTVDGAFALRGRLSAQRDGFSLDDIVAEYGTSRLSGRIAQGVVPGRDGAQPRTSYTAELEAPVLDVTGLAVAGGPVRLAIAAMLARDEDIALRVRATRLIYQGDVLRDVDADVQITARAVRIASLRFANDGAGVEVEGTLAEPRTAPKGTLAIAIRATDGAALGRLAERAGLPSGLKPDAGFAALAPARLGGTVQFAARAPGTVDLVLDGTMQGAPARLVAALDGGLDGWRAKSVDVTAMGEAKTLLALFGGAGADSKASSVLAGSRLAIRAVGIPTDALTTRVTLAGRAAGAAYQGRAKVTPAGLLLDGEITVDAQSNADLFAFAAEALGAGANRTLALSDPSASERATARARLSYADGRLLLDAMEARLGGPALTGVLDIATAGTKRTVSGELRIDTVDVFGLVSEIVERRPAGVAAARALIESGTLWPEDSFDLAFLDRFQGSVQLDIGRFGLANNLGIDNVRAKLDLTPDKIELREIAAGSLGGQLRARAAVARTPGGGQLGLDLALTGIDFAAASLGATGKADVAISLSGRGGNPRAALVAAQGQGMASLADVQVNHTTPSALATAIEAALKGSPDAVTPTLRRLIRDAGGDIPLGSRSVPIEVAQGVVRLKPLAIELPDGRALVSGRLDVGAATFEGEWRIEAVDRTASTRPRTYAVRYLYAGPASRLGRAPAEVSLEPLERELAVRKMERDVEELERLRRLDEERAREEQRRRASEAAEQRANEAATPVLPGGVPRSPYTPSGAPASGPSGG